MCVACALRVAGHTLETDQLGCLWCVVCVDTVDIGVHVNVVANTDGHFPVRLLRTCERCLIIVPPPPIFMHLDAHRIPGVLLLSLFLVCGGVTPWHLLQIRVCCRVPVAR